MVQKKLTDKPATDEDDWKAECPICGAKRFPENMVRAVCCEGGLICRECEKDFVRIELNPRMSDMEKKHNKVYKDFLAGWVYKDIKCSVTLYKPGGEKGS